VLSEKMKPYCFKLDTQENDQVRVMYLATGKKDYAVDFFVRNKV
jgi:hypothetical protein